MMAFRMTRGGYEARATGEERQMLEGLARDIVYMLGSDITHEVERREMLKDADPLEAFEAELAGIAEAIEDEEDGVDRHMSLPADTALEALLPDMSEDPDLANELRTLTEDAVAGSKVDNLVTFYTGLQAASEQSDVPVPGFGQRVGNRVIVRNDDAEAWLSAMNDIRLVLAARLDVSNDEDAESVYQRAGLFTGSASRTASEDLPSIETPEDMMAVLYAMITWWQESLVGAVRNKALRR